MDLEDLACWVCTELSETTVHGYTVSFKVLTEQKLATAAVEALIAEL